MRDLVKALKALSDETRLRILDLLFERECCVCEVMQALNISQTRASRNLNILHNAGFLQVRREGLWSLYSIDRAGMPECFADLLEITKETLEENSLSIPDLKQLLTVERISPIFALKI